MTLNQISPSSTDAWVEEWEDHLDSMGPLASFEALISHYEKAPPQSPSKQYLRDVLSSRAHVKNIKLSLK